MTKTYSIPAWNQGDFEVKMNRLSNKANKLNLSFGFTLEGKTQKTQKDDLGFDYSFTVYNYSVYGESPVINGYTFLAKIEPFEGTNLIHSHNETFNFESYRNSELTCEHCNIKRQRNFYFLIMSENGIVKMVGQNCLANYIDLPNAESVAEFYSSFIELKVNESDEDIESFFRNGKAFLNIESFLPYVVLSVSENGYQKTDENNPTKQDALTRMYDKDNKSRPTDSHIEESKMIISFCKEQLELKSKPSEYEFTLLTLLNAGVMSEKHAGYIASLVPMYSRMHEHNVKNANKPASNYVGNIGDKINIVGTVQKYTNFKNDFNGTTHIYTFNNDGNIIIYFASKSFDIELEDKVNIKATIKKLDIYNGTNQTVITRGKIEKI